MSGQSLRNDGSEQKARRAAVTWDLTLAGRLVRCAARKAPPGLADRLEEEWLADLSGRQRALSRILFALGCCWATRVIAREFGAAAAAGGSSGSTQRALVAHAGHDFSRFSRRTVALVAIVCLHIGILYLYLTGFAGIFVVNGPNPIAGVFIDKTINAHQAPHLPPPRITRTVFDTFPTPDFPLFKVPAGPNAITVAPSPRPVAGPLPSVPPKPVDRVAGGPGAGFPNTEDYYPPAARRLGEAGSTVVDVCVDPRGRLTAAPTIAGSSGIRLIDQGALRLATAGSGHYRPSTQNGQPVSSCYAFRIRFQLEDQ